FPMGSIAPACRALAIQERRQRSPVEMGWDLAADQIEHGRHDIDGFREGLHRTAGSMLSARIANDQRDVVAAVKEAPFAEHEVIAHHLGMVGREDDDSVVPVAAFPYARQNTTKLRVDLRDHAVIERTYLPELSLVPVGHKPLMTDQEALLPLGFEIEA